MIISLIAAVSQNGVIGKNNQLPWHLPDDMKHFMETTIYHHVIMGRKSYEALPPKFKPLPHRINIVVTHRTTVEHQPYRTVNSIEAGIAIATQHNEKEVFIIGGAQIYQQIMPLVQCMYITEIKAEVEGDTYFPKYNKAEWIDVSRKHHPADDKHRFAFDIVKYERIVRNPQ